MQAVQTVTLICDNRLDFSLPRGLEKKEVHGTVFLKEEEEGGNEDVKGEKRWILEHCLAPFLTPSAQSDDPKEVMEGVTFHLGNSIKIDLKWRYQTGLEPRNVMYNQMARGSLSFNIIPEAIDVEKIINQVISFKSSFRHHEFKVAHIILPIGAKTSYETLGSRLFAEISLQTGGENLDKEAYVYLGLYSLENMVKHRVISVKELKNRVVVWKDGHPFHWTQGSSATAMKGFSAAEAHLNEGVRVIALLLVKTPLQASSEETLEKPKTLEADGQWQTDPLDLSDEDEACRPTFLQRSESPFVETERLLTDYTYRIEEGVVVLNQVVAVDMTKPTGDSFSIHVDELSKHFESNMKEGRGEKQ